MASRALRYLFVFASLFMISGIARAQKEIVHIYGQLRDDSNKKKLDGCKVTVFKDGSQTDFFDTGNSGKYDLSLTLGYTYDIRFAKEGYLTKIIRLDTRNIPEEERYGGFDMNVPGTLFPEREGFNTDLLKEPIAIARYFPNEDGLKFDEEYSKKKIAMIAAEHKRLDDLAKNYEKLKKQFDELLSAGDKKMAESKYGDAMEKYQAALNIFPKDEPAKNKYNDAKARYDAENANKEFEVKYQQLMTDAKNLFDKEQYAEAKSKYQEASKMKEKEKAPKEGIWDCDQAMKELDKRKGYEAILADADSKFSNKDFATSIDKYKEASVIYPKETYPKDQIVKAELALKAMLEDEASRLARIKDYEAKMGLAQGYEADDKLEKAISSYREASFILPEETLPGEKITELENILAERKKQSGAIAKNKEQDEREKQYNDLIQMADEFFLSKKLKQSREKYEEASEVKPEANWPKTRIELIDMMLNDDGASAARLRIRAINDSLMALKDDAMSNIARRKLELEKTALEQAEARRVYQEEKRLAGLNQIDSKKGVGNSQADAQAEDEVEQYYRDAKEKEDAARYNEVRQRIVENQSYHKQKSSAQNELIAQREVDIVIQKESAQEQARKGDIFYTTQVMVTEQKKKEGKKKQEDAERSADSRMRNNQKEIQEDQKAQSEMSANDRQRSLRVAENESLKRQVSQNQANAERHGEVLRRDNQNTIERTQQQRKEVSYKGEEIRQEREDELTQTVKAQKRAEEDKSKSANEKIKTTSMQVDKQKEAAQDQQLKGEYSTTAKANEIEIQKAELELQNKERQVAESQKHFDKFNEVNNANGTKNADNSEEAERIVTENSYKFGNKMITERKVTVGNTENIYKKVVSKTAIYYFKNGNSISETTWKTETLSN